MRPSVRDQYLRLKQPYPDALLLFRLGDFYECYDADARVAARALELTLTARDFGDSQRIAMCAVPYHAVERQIKQLVARGYKVAIAEQIGDPRTTTGLVVREVVRVISPSSALWSPVAPASHADTMEAPAATPNAPDDVPTAGAPPMPSLHATEKVAAGITQLALFDIAAHDGD